MADLSGSSTFVLRIRVRDSGLPCIAEAGTRAPPSADRMANRNRSKPGLLRGDHALGVPVDLRAIRLLRSSPLAIDLYVWLTYRMSYLRRPTLVPWQGLENQFGADYTRPRDFRRRVLSHLESVLRVYPTVRVGATQSGLRLYRSSPHVQARSTRRLGAG